MTFKDVNPGEKIYLFDKPNVSYLMGKIVNRGFPYTPQDAPITSTYKVVDVTIDVEGKQATYTIPENSTITYARNGDLVLSLDQSLVINEVENLIKLLDQYIENLPKYKENREKAVNLRKEIDPVFKREQAYEKRFSDIESQNKRIEGALEKILKKLED